MRSRCFFLISVALLMLLTVTTAHGDRKTKAIAMDRSGADVAMKLAEKLGYPKKANSGKKRPTKSPPATEATAPDAPVSNATDFTHLAGDDLEFIAALEKQFSLYGGKVKIKVERDNSTDSKNPKRTIDGELGYGYSNNGYEYRKPMFMFYPYSQKDIAADAPGYYPASSHAGSSVSVQPSYSYELQPQVYEVPQQPQADLPTVDGHSYPVGSGPLGEHQQQYKEPVIVLRIPGPPKYAAHLQALLQQYLQVRATQYLNILENSAHKDEYHGQQQLLQNDYQGEDAASLQQQQQYAAQQYEDATSSAPHQSQEEQQYSEAPQQHYDEGQHFEPSAPSSSPLQQQPHFDYEQQEPLSVQHSPPPPAYSDVEDVYHGYKDHHPQHVGHHHQHDFSSSIHSEPEYCPETDYHVADVPAAPGPPYYFPQHGHHYEQVHLSTGMTHSYDHNPLFLFPLPNPIYEAPEADPHLSQHHSIYSPEKHLHEYEQQLHTSENNPRPTHTQIRFTPNNGQENLSGTMHALPSIRPYERHPPAPVSTKAFVYLQQRQQQLQQQHAQQQQQDLQQQQQQQAEASVEKSPRGSGEGNQHHQQVEAAGEQREAVKRPHNYHAHPGRGRRRSSNGNKRDSSKSLTSTNFGAKLSKAKDGRGVQ